MRKEILVSRYGPAAEFVAERLRKCGKLPWVATYLNILSRCTRPSDKKFTCYGGRNIQCRIKASELRVSFYRDKAYLMRQPSIDRIDPEGDYTPENTRWIEMELNRVQRGLRHPKYAEEAGALGADILRRLEATRWPVRIRRLLLRRLLTTLAKSPARATTTA